MPLEYAQARRVLEDPVTIRALAHPLRLRLLDLVTRSGSMTAAEAARAVGISQGLASHHLRQLAKYGFVDHAPAANNRDRPWRPTSVSISWPSSFDDAEAGAAVDVLEQLLAARATENLAQWQQRRAEADSGWRENAGIDQHLLYLTVDEFVELRRAMDRLIAPLVSRRRAGHLDAGGQGTVPVDVTIIRTPVSSPSTTPATTSEEPRRSGPASRRRRRSVSGADLSARGDTDVQAGP